MNIDLNTIKKWLGKKSPLGVYYYIENSIYPDNLDIYVIKLFCHNPFWKKDMMIEEYHSNLKEFNRSPEEAEEEFVGMFIYTAFYLDMERKFIEFCNSEKDEVKNNEIDKPVLKKN